MGLCRQHCLEHRLQALLATALVVSARDDLAVRNAEDDDAVDDGVRVAQAIEGYEQRRHVAIGDGLVDRHLDVRNDSVHGLDARLQSLEICRRGAARAR
jgi:hypothetical protein